MDIKLSIIIPTFNRETTLKATLRTIAELDINRDLLEVIVIDNGSTDNTTNVCDDFTSKNKSINFKYKYDSIPGLMTGRHLGGKIAQGEILTFIDDDVELSCNWAKSIIRIMDSMPDVMLLTGPNLPKYQSYPPVWLDKFWTQIGNGRYCGALSLLDLGNNGMYIEPTLVWGLNFTIRKEAYLFLKGFHPDTMPSNIQFLQGDGETGLSLKAQENQYKAYYHPDIMVYHFVPDFRMTIAYFEKRYYFQGVADSYTDIRKKIGLYREFESEIENKSSFKKTKRLIKRKLKSIFNNSSNQIINESEEFMSLMQKRYSEGFAYHQNHFNTNPVVHEWVLKPDYMDYTLPHEFVEKSNNGRK